MAASRAAAACGTDSCSATNEERPVTPPTSLDVSGNASPTQPRSSSAVVSTSSLLTVALSSVVAENSTLPSMSSPQSSAQSCHICSLDTPSAPSAAHTSSKFAPSFTPAISMQLEREHMRRSRAESEASAAQAWTAGGRDASSW
eukprot:1191777-Prymnesium_polylepis.2